jgi:O-antigen/teichoic acid export membrane protein
LLALQISYFAPSSNSFHLPKQLHKHLSAQTIVAISQVLFPLITYPVVTKVLGAGGLGAVQFVDSLAQIFILFASAGIPLYGLRKVATTEGAQRSLVVWELLLLQALFALPACLLMLLAGILSGVAYPLLALAVANIVTACFSVEWYFQGREQFTFLAWRSVTIRMLSALAIWVFVKSSSDLVIYYAILVGAVVLTSVLNSWTLMRQNRKPPTPLNWRQHLKAANIVFLVYVLASVYSLTDIVLLGWLSNENAVGFYSLGYKLVRMSALFIISWGLVFMPQMATHAKDAAILKERIRRSQQLVYFLSLPIGTFFFLLAPEIVSFLAHEGFTPSVAVIRILSAVPFFLGLSHLAGAQVFISLQKEATYLWWLLVAISVGLMMNLGLIPLLAELGAAIANLTTEAVLATGLIYSLAKKGLFKPQLRALCTTLFASALLWPFVVLFRSLDLSAFWVVVCSGTAFGVVYLLAQAKWFRFFLFQKEKG